MPGAWKRSVGLEREPPEDMPRRQREAWIMAMVLGVKARKGYDADKAAYDLACTKRIDAMEAMYAAGMSQTSIAEFFGVTQQMVGKVVLRRKEQIARRAAAITQA